MNNTDTDNWGQLLSDFGIEDQAPQKPEREPPKAVVPAEPEQEVTQSASTEFDGFGAGLIDPPTEVAAEPLPEESAKVQEKKSIFSRFPKVHFFGAPPQVSLDSVMDEVHSPSLGGKGGFTDNKLEKVPLSQERSSRIEKKKDEEPNTWSIVASQIETLAAGGETKPQREERPAKRRISSMFDDPIPESEESKALKDLMGEPAPQDQKRRSGFLEEETGSRQRDRGRKQPSALTEEREPRGRGARYKPPVEVDDLPETDFAPIDEESFVPQSRTRRGSRYTGERDRYENSRQDNRVRDDESQEEWSEIDAALQSEQERPSQRGDRHRRGKDYGGRIYDKEQRGERARKPVFDREPMDEETSGIVMTFENVPSWDDAIGDIISGNISRHRSSSGRGRR